MKKYKCPTCGKISSSMYCDVCEKSIPNNCAIDSYSSDSVEEWQAETTNDLLVHTKVSNDILRRIEHNTSVMKVIMVISFICALISLIV